MGNLDIRLLVGFLISGLVNFGPISIDRGLSFCYSALLFGFSSFFF